jgi:hypothetical protein
MSFQAYIDNIKAKTGKKPKDFHVLAQKIGLTGADVKATQVVAWLKRDFGLGHGHAMAIWRAFILEGWVDPPGKAKPASTPAKRKAGE